MIDVFLQILVVAFLGMVVLWALQWRWHDAGIVDAGWAFGMTVAAVLIAFQAPGDLWRRVIIAVIAGGWGLRLGLYLLLDRIVGKEREDGRYARMRAAMGRYAQVGFFIFFQVQTGFVLIFALPLYAATCNAAPLGWLDLVGILIAVAAIAGEIVADRQLARHRADPSNRHVTCRTGLWRYTRHPNYFCEWLHWFSYAFLGIGSPLAWLAASGPVFMGVFLWKITGIPHTEKQALSHRSDYAEYMRTTSGFIPWPPRKG